MNKKLASCFFIMFTLIGLAVVGQEKPENDARSLMSTYYTENFNPFQKSNWFVAFNMSLNNEKYENSTYRFEQISKGNRENYQIDIRSGYYFSDYFAASFGFIFGGENFERRVPQLLGYIDKSSSTTTFGFSPDLRSSIPVVPNQRLNLYVDLGFSFIWGLTDGTEMKDEVVLDSFNSNGFDFGIGIKPGVTFFVLENFALEIGLEILGYNYSSLRTNYDNETPEEKYASHAIDFNLSLSTLQLSLSYYIGAKKKK